MGIFCNVIIVYLDIINMIFIGTFVFVLYIDALIR